MVCARFSGCEYEFLIGSNQRDSALRRAAAYDIQSPKAEFPGRYPYRWRVREPTLVIHHYSDAEQHWFRMEEVSVGAVRVHVMVYMVRNGTLAHSIEYQKHYDAEAIFRAELLGMQVKYTVHPDEAAQTRERLREQMDEAELPESWRPPPPPT